jgi:hypothetical protein
MTRRLALAAFLLAGCATTSSSTTTPAAAAASADGQPEGIEVHTPPPAPPPETRPPSPGFGYIYVAGYWEWIDGSYVWHPGRWIPGKADYELVRARYEAKNGAWIFYKPHWKRRLRSSSSNG